MTTPRRPRVYISYTWRTSGLKERVFALAEQLRASGIDCRIDLYYWESRYGFVPPSKRADDDRDPWIVWEEEQVQNADCILVLCSREYKETVPDPVSGVWPHVLWDWQFMQDALKTGRTKIGQLIPVGYGGFQVNSCNVPAFLQGETYYDLESPSRVQDLLRRIRCQFQFLQPRDGVFVSYSHKDQKWLDELLQHLAHLERRGIAIWTDREILPGERWREKIEMALASARVAVLLVTPAFLKSSFIHDHELEPLLRAAASEGLTIFWIPVEPSAYQEYEICHFQAAHDPAHPLSSLKGAKRDQALVSIAEKLSRAIGAGPIQ